MTVKNIVIAAIILFGFFCYFYVVPKTNIEQTDQIMYDNKFKIYYLCGGYQKLGLSVTEVARMKFDKLVSLTNYCNVLNK